MINYIKILSSMLIIALVFVSGCTDQTEPALSENDDSGSVTPSAVRDLPGDCIEPGAMFDVHITVSDYGSFGMVNEILCDDWIYINSSIHPEQVRVTDKNITFVLIGESSFNYTVQVPSEHKESCSIEGTLKNEDKVEYSVEGDSQVCIL
jgi:hypothetical protein